jgi:LmbE family N-acetylglucosaminyl deacetylase
MRCQAEGGRAVLVTATLGQRGKAGDPPICRPEELEARREDELRTAARIIGFSDLHLLGYQDRELADAPIADAPRPGRHPAAPPPVGRPDLRSQRLQRPP